MAPTAPGWRGHPAEAAYPGRTGIDGGGWKNRPWSPTPVPWDGGWSPTTRFVPTVTSKSGLVLSTPAPTYEQLSTRLEMPVGSIGPTRDRALARLRDDADLARAVAG